MAWFLVKFRRFEIDPEGKKGREIESWDDIFEAPDAASAIKAADESAEEAAGEDEEVHFDLEPSPEGPPSAGAGRARPRKPAEQAHTR